MGYLRFLLACIVALGHTPGALSTLGTIGALAAVEAFFFISGFYMAATFSTHYTGANRAVRFWLSRFTRLYPLYFTVILLTALVWQVGPHLGWALNWTRTFDYFAKPHGP